MSVLGSSSAPCRPITAVAWVSNSSGCPGHFTLISQTEDGASANFIRGFAIKSGYFLCYSKDLSAGMVVADVQVITDKETIPHGYCYIPEFLEQKASVGKKKRICVRLVPMGSVTTAVLDLKLTVKNKTMVQQYTCLGNPSDVSSKVSFRRSKLDTNNLMEDVNDSGNHSNHSSIHSITGMDGVPFSLHPKFSSQSDTKVSASILSDIRIRSVQDIENEYNYTFAVEEQAARRLCPSVSS
ncbi:multivesicular body subunit 12A isoform X2 [Carassius auratus]|uniref:Multivesicular body subunit 12A n=1 Tax=Carassius auratus TaxID=7957 RepID=A0A6P6J317_CARAU|nr:multivesicular body subunit 12A-like isoform X2 [Carassius auratus]